MTTLKIVILQEKDFLPNCGTITAEMSRLDMFNISAHEIESADSIAYVNGRKKIKIFKNKAGVFFPQLIETAKLV